MLLNPYTFGKYKMLLKRPIDKCLHLICGITFHDIGIDTVDPFPVLPSWS